MKTENTINCPNCQHSFPLEAAFANQLRGKIDNELRTGYDTRLAEERKTLTRELTCTAKAEAERTFATHLAGLEALAAEREVALKRAHAKIATTGEEAAIRAREEFSAERKGLEDELARQRSAVADLHKNELELRREKVRLEGARQELEVQSARALDAERIRLRDALSRTLDTERIRVREELASAHFEAQKLREAEYNHQTVQLQQQVEELRRKLSAGGEQRRGEVCEVRLEELLRGVFPADTIEAVARGVNGADVFQRVCPPGGAKACGTIIYENKHTAAWNPRWLSKLKDDQLAECAEIAVLVTATLPKEVTTFALIEGVWVTSFACLPSLAHVLRVGLIQLATYRQAVVGRGEKIELVYAYLTSENFRRHVEAVFDAVSQMDQDLDKEKRATTAAWNRRTKQLDRLTEAMAGLYGDLQGIAGSGALPIIEALELTTLLEDSQRGDEQVKQVMLV